MLQNYVRQLLVFAFILVSFTALGQSFGTSVSARYGDGCRLDFYNTTNVKIFSLRGSELRYWYNPSGQIIVRDENTQVTDLYGISGLATLIDSIQSVCLAGVCGGGVTPPDTNSYTYCGAPVWEYWGNNSGGIDTLSYSLSGSVNNPLIYFDNQYYIHLWNAQRTYINYRYGYCQFSGNTCDQIDTCTAQEGLECSRFAYFDVKANGVSYNALDSFACPAETMNIESLNYLLDVVQFDTTILYLDGVTVSNDTIISQYITIPLNNIDSFSVLRTLGVVLSDINLDTANATIGIEAYPVKTSGQTYASSSFKIEKIAFADITAGTISGSSYNPNLGTQTNTFALTTGKNTFKVSVQDTDGNIAYTIFQVSKSIL